MARIYVADKETLDKTHANTAAILAALEEEGGEHKKAVRYGIKISKSDSGKASRVTYIYDAVGMTPAVMNFSEGTFNYGSWGNVEFVKNNYPCMVKYDGTEDYKLSPNDYTKKEDGTTASDVANTDYAGNAMAAFKGGWLCQYETETDEYIIWSNVKYDDGYNAYHRTAPDGVVREGFYRRIYKPALLNNVARSISGQQSMHSKNATQERTYIKANGEAWEHTSWWEWNYIIALLKIMAKTEDLQGAYGNGNMNGYVNDAAQHYGILTAGTLNDKGQFFGYNTNNQQVKVFHTEAMWGDQWERICHMICDKGVVKVQPYGDGNFTGAGFETVLDYKDLGITASASGYMRDTVMTKAGRFAKTFNGSSSTYTCDYGSINPTIVSVPLVGGSCGDGLACGACVNLGSTAGGAAWNIAPGLSCKMPNAA